ncbi:Phage antirepressor protein YoqD, KilAC domain [Thermoanaerobacter thermohydrosulfuricus]|uniref:Phage antirepressor protein YoqD, KilAC domain n=1 Tax=Thermoanaerobacter thermohydrosulfuricus TaxID=1516 RepID=A0A1G7VQZ7_THETY|nr:phage antirepressor KilAC domain-containing protein [Thermoanaerobacter thermohydrosulfuricus]SDG62011.1 Phage antirepressor protein YoqD, KilAC domain [Thermoanaerobacter thermohydrosulfuricus]
MLIAKSLGTDKAWEQYNYLVEYYFATEKALKEDGAIVSDVDKFIGKYFSTLPKETQTIIKGLLQEMENKNEELNKLKPKGDYYDTVLQKAGLVTTTDIAKDLGMSARKLHNILHDQGLIFKQGKTWFLYSSYQHLVPEYADYHITEYGQTLKWTEKGREFIINLLKQNGFVI